MLGELKPKGPKGPETLNVDLDQVETMLADREGARRFRDYRKANPTPYTPRANLNSISHRCHPILVAFVWELT